MRCSTSARSSSAAMTGAILTKFGRAPTTWTTVPSPIGAYATTQRVAPEGMIESLQVLKAKLQKSCKVAPEDLASRCIDAAVALTESAARTGFRGPDPFDGLWFQWPEALVGGRRRRQAIMQLHVRSPVDVRRLYRRSHPLIPKAL